MDAAPRWCTARPIAAAPGLRRDGTGSGSWSCRRGHTRAVGWQGGRAAAMTFQDAARPGTGRPRLRTRPTVTVGRLACRPARSAFFDRRIGIADTHQPALAPAQRLAGRAPGAASLPAQAGLVQGARAGEPADPGQAVRGPAQRLLQQAQRPGGSAILLALRRSCPLGQNALLLPDAIADPRSAAMVRAHGGQPFAVEAADPGRERLVVAASDPMGGGGVAGSIGNRQQGAGTVDLGGGSPVRAAQAGELLALLRGERAQGIFAVARHRTPRNTRISTPLYQIRWQMTH